MRVKSYIHQLSISNLDLPQQSQSSYLLFEMSRYIPVLLFLILANVNISLSNPKVRQVDRSLYEKVSYERGPHPKATLESRAEFTFLGTINGKNFYIERVLRTNIRGWEACFYSGMWLARFDTQEELDFVAARMTDSDDYAWTDGLNVQHNDGFRWGYYGDAPSAFTFQFKDLLALTIGRRLAPEPSVLVAEFENREHYSICQI